MTDNNTPTPNDDPLERLTSIQRLGQALFEREAGRLAAKHGVDDPRTQRVMRTASGAGDMLHALEVTRDAAPQDVSAAPGESVIYGRVTTDNLDGAATVEVSIEDTSGRVMRAAGSATTDASGRYTLRIPSGVAERLAGKDYIVTVRDSTGAVIYRAAQTIKLALNQAVELDVNVGTQAPLRRTTGRPTRPVEPTKSSGDSDSSADFSVTGTVVRATGKPVSSVMVRVYDKDRRFDDLLGAALTNRRGQFTVRYRRQDFSENETNADLFFVVTDASETELLSTANRVIFNAAREVVVTLSLQE